MLRGMRGFLDKYQKYLLVLLAAGLAAIFTLPIGQRYAGSNESPVGQLYGQKLYETEMNLMARRWQTVGLRPLGGDYYRTYILLKAARAQNISVGDRAVAQLVDKYPPYRERVEYILADPSKLAANITPSDAAVQEFYDRIWPDKSRPLDQVKDELRRELAGRMAQQAASDKIKEAYEKILQAPARGEELRRSFSDAAAALGLIHDLTPAFSRDSAQQALAPLAGQSIAASTLAGELPPGLVDRLFTSPVGKPGRIERSGDKYFICRVIETSAGFMPDGTLIADDWGWSSGIWVATNAYKDRDSLVRDKSRMDTSELATTFREYLTVSKYLQLVMGGSLAPDSMTADARSQVLAFAGEQIKSLITPIPVASFLDSQDPSEAAVMDFYNARKSEKFPSDPRNPNFGYYPPPRIRIEYVVAPREQYPDFAAAKALKAVMDKAQDKMGAPLPLESAAAGAGLEYRVSAPFAEHEVAAVLPELAGSKEFTELAFSSSLKPHSARLSRTESVEMRPFSPVLKTDTASFVFRVLQQIPPAVVEFDSLGAVERAEVARDLKWKNAVDRAAEAAQRMRADAARALLVAVAADNNLTIQHAKIGATGAIELPPALVERVQKLPFAPGEILWLAKDGESYYTAVITSADLVTRELQFDYVKIAPDRFTGAFDPASQSVNTRAIELAGNGMTPTDEQVEQARKLLKDEWAKKDFPGRYVEYLHQQALKVYPEFLKSNKLEIAQDATLDLRTSPFFNAQDAVAMQGDAALVKAAFTLEPNKLTVVSGDKAAAVMLLEGRDSRKQVRVEFVTVRPADYDPLSVVVTDGQAAEYFAANRAQFRVPPGVQAQFIFASFEAIANIAADSIDDAAVKEYYDQNKAAAYANRELDNDLKSAIRAQLALRAAQTTGAELAIRKADAALRSPANSDLSKVAADIPGLKAGATPFLSDKDSRIPQVGYAPGLIKQMLESQAGVLSAPVRTDDGWVIFRVAEKRDARDQELADVMPAVRDAVRKQLLTDRAKAALAQARDRLVKDPTASLDKEIDIPAVSAQLPFGTHAITTGYMEREQALGVLMSAALRNAVFDAKPGTITPIIESDEGLQLARVLDAQDHDVVKVNYVFIPAAFFTDSPDASDDEAHAYYEKNKSRFELPASYELEYLLIDRRNVTGEPTDAELKDAYAQLQAQFAKPGEASSFEDVRSQLTRLVQAHKSRVLADELAAKTAAGAAAGESFEKLAGKVAAAEYTGSVTYVMGSDENSLELSGVAGLPAFLASAERGGVSPILQSYAGPMLVRVKQAKAAGVPGFEAVKKRVKAELALARGLERANDMAKQVVAKAGSPTAQSLQEAAAQFTVHTKRSLPLVPVETPFLNRWQPMKASRTLLMRIFDLLPGETTDPPVVDGERAEMVFLATALETRQTPLLQPDLVLNELALQMQSDRLRQVLAKIDADLRSQSR